MEPPIVITNGVVFTGNAFVEGLAVMITNGKIAGLIPPDGIPEEAEIFDVGGDVVAPGFIDLQVYGGGGRLFSADPAGDALDEIANALVAGGTTSFMITMATNTMAVVDQSLQVLNGYTHPALLGLHLEGPYLNPNRRGAHPAEYIRQPEQWEIAALLKRAKGRLRMMTIAPERFNGETIRLLLDAGVVLSAGHSDASFSEATAGFSHGIQAVTHLFNAMSPLHHRNPGLPAAVFQSDKVVASIIADGIHVDYEVIAISKKLLNERLFLITDAVAETQTGIYRHVFNGDRYSLPDGTLSGSSLTMMQAVANCVERVGIPLDEALRMASLYPALLIGEEDLGRISVGSVANLVVFDQQYSVKHVFLGGSPQ
ncbi:N-acetylglucosamine-6-phosphate deacetylase [Parapedobacter composti]|uniref:N-acetylglucosamine-6-phosphate deacetylase n=1 Tax=Parapedobacter composti TaxID=623281 RepID=A0A1I1FKL4_9SPHI|nr:N-acetylglucosamine-6-phosphate deacetylase [Parapedobacter composti]SFB99532.1 N-acetylglucosamine-6-phosphate deacetylase [Parapedobacter composti]